ncbi:hypothetical protein EPK99_06625 [Neorhizobium lilium]|uniref:Uncharacterized protein n=1 Tax=Neorhizobium lilium TaxID=2503024 RepID=A0A3S3RK63_9HYPH|nr:hypothetical protein [Neorhizobium lilium]RWX78298.1 hypothetical protein EPK99_06625 [Neorhizobium lilium]
MAYVKRFQIQRLTASNATEYYTLFAGQDDWTRDDMDAVEFSTFDKAAHRADRVGGLVVEFSRQATALEAMMLERAVTNHFSIAAE